MAMKYLFWIDMEMTGLDVKTNRIIECAAVVTDFDLKILDQFHAVVKQPQSLLDSMDDWNKKTHSESGLIQKIPNGITEVDLDAALAKLGQKFYGSKEKIILAGNSIHQDKLFVDTYLPTFSALLSYRMLDVSSFKELFRNKWGIEFKKNKNHQALADVQESMDELKHYLGFIQVPKS